MSYHDHDNDQGPGLVGALSGLVTLLLFVAGLVWLIAAVSAPNDRSAPTAPRKTVHIYTAEIHGETVTCTETHDHETGARSRAC